MQGVLEKYQDAYILSCIHKFLQICLIFIVAFAHFGSIIM